MNKPLIFIFPLSESLRKLKDVIEETAEEDGIEIYECDSLQEAGQLISTVGASLTLMADPKKCAKILKSFKKIIKKLKSKVILVSAKNLPRNTVAKFEKAGLSEFIVEPIAPKSLHYKVNFLVKSLPVPKEEKEDKNQKKSLKKDSIEGEGEDLYGDKEQKKIQSMLSFDEEPSETSFKGEAPPDLRNEDKKLGATEKLAMSFEEEPPPPSPDFGVLEIDPETGGPPSGFGDLDIDPAKKEMEPNVSLDLEDGSSQSGPPPGLELEDSDPSVAPSGFGLELEEEKDSSKSSAPSLDLEVGEDSSSKNSLDIEEAKTKSKDNKHPGLDLDGDDFANGSPSKLNLEENKASKALDIPDLEFEEEDDNKDTGPPQLDFEMSDDDFKENKDALENLIDEEDDSSSKPPSLDLESENDNSQSGPPRLDLEESGNSKKNRSINQPIFQEDKDKDQDGPPKLDLESSKDKKEKGLDGLDLDENSEKNRSSGPPQLNLEEDKKEKNGPALNLEADDESKRDRESAAPNLQFAEEGEESGLGGLDIEDEKDKSKDNTPKLNLEENENKKAEDSGSKLQFDEEGKNIDNSNPSLEIEEDKKSKSVGSGLELEDEDKYDDRVKGIEFEDDVKKKEREVSSDEANWDGLIKRSKETDENWDFKKKEDSLAFSIEKKQKGEATIDYGQIYKEFSEFSDREKEEIIAEENEKEEGATEEEEESETIFEVDSKGLEHVVEVLKRYLNKDFKDQDILKYISDVIQEKNKGDVVFFSYDKNKNEFSEVQNTILEKAPNDAEIKEQWETLKKDQFGNWKEVTLPSWSDKTFQQQEIDFLYPYFEGVSRLGFVIVFFKQGFKEDQYKQVEVLLESARGIFLEIYHKAMGIGHYKGIEKKQVKENRVVGFFKKLFRIN